MTLVNEQIKTHWTSIAPLLIIPNEREYNAAVKRLNEMLDEIGSNEKHPLYSLLDTLATLIHAYEEEHYPIPASTTASVLRFLIEEHGINPVRFARSGFAGSSLRDTEWQSRV